MFISEERNSEGDGEVHKIVQSKLQFTENRNFRTLPLTSGIPTSNITALASPVSELSDVNTSTLKEQKEQDKDLKQVLHELIENDKQ